MSWLYSRTMRLVLAKRADPALPLAKLRLQGRLLEIRRQELRITGKKPSATCNGLRHSL